jgi:myo-inositol-1(or 4)-monophosphatase
MLNIAVRAARSAGSLIIRHVERVDALEITRKGMHDFVTAVDQNAERVIIDALHRAYPSHGFVAEESGRHDGDDFVWVIDPLDGTTNFLHGFPQFCVSIALKHRGRLEYSVVFDPLRQEIFTATRGGGAQLNDRRIRVSKQKGLDEALLGTGFPLHALAELDTYLATLKALVPSAAGIRRGGSAALDLAYVAAGRLDGYWQFYLKEWDYAAGALLVQEAGGLLSSPGGGEDWYKSGNIVAGTPKVHAGVLQSIQSHLTDSVRE